MVTLKLERLEVPVEVCGGLLIESIVERVKINRLTRVPMNQKQSRSMNESWDVLGHALGMDSSVADDVLSEEVLSKRTKLKSL
jgi:hypothetical protein